MQRQGPPAAAGAAPPSKRSRSAELAGAAAGEPLQPRARDPHPQLVDLSDSEDAPVPAPRVFPVAVVQASLWKRAFKEKDPMTWICRICNEERRCAANSTGNLGTHLKRAHRELYDQMQANNDPTQHAVVEDLIKNAISSAKRSQPTNIRRFLKRNVAAPNKTRSEVSWLLWATKRGIPYDAMLDPLFLLARQVCRPLSSHALP
jgi:hypothetical protein